MDENHVAELGWTPLQCSAHMFTREKFSLEQYEEKIYLYGGITDHSHSNSLEVFQFSDLIHSPSFPIHTTNISDPIMNHESICSVDGLMIIFGGRSLSGTTSKLQVYDITKGVWFELNTKGDVPGKRERHSITLIESTLYVFGGLLEGPDQTSEPTNEFYKLAIETSVWQKIITKKTPKPRYGHTTVALGSKLVMFGGKSSKEPLNDLPQFDISKDVEWRIVKALGRVPEARWGHSACIVADKHMIIYGGWNGKKTLSDIFLLDCTEYVWWEIMLKHPIPRTYGRMMFKDEALYYFGGRTDTEVRSEVMRFDLCNLLTGGSDYYIFDAESCTIKDKPVDRSKNPLEEYRYIRVLDFTPIELVYLVEKIGEEAQTYTAAMSKSNRSMVKRFSTMAKKLFVKSTDTKLLGEPHEGEGAQEDGKSLTTSDLLKKNHKWKRYFVIKKVKKDHVSTEQEIKRLLFLRERLILLDNPFIVKTQEFYKDTKNLYVITKAALGGHLYNYIYQSETKLPIEAIRFYAAQLYLGLFYLHRERLIHRNLRPETILMNYNGYLKIEGLKYIKSFGPGERTFTVIGPSMYHSPEIIKMTGYREEVDWWAFGVILYEMYYKRTPFENSDPMQIYKNILTQKIAFDGGIDADLEHLITGLLTVDLQNRVGKGNPEQIKEHPFFTDIHFQEVYERDMEPPIPPDFDHIFEIVTEDDGTLFEVFRDKETPIGNLNDPFKDF